MKDFIYLIVAASIFGAISALIIGTALMYLERERPIFKGESEQFKKLFQRTMILIWIINGLIFIALELLKNVHY
jgi:hypothetical protein